MSSRLGTQSYDHMLHNLTKFLQLRVGAPPKRVGMILAAPQNIGEVFSDIPLLTSSHPATELLHQLLGGVLNIVEGS